MTAAESKKFIVKDNPLTVYSIEVVDNSEKVNISWVDEDGTKETVKYEKSIIDYHVGIGNWKYIEEEKEFSIERPILTERKVGKVQMDLFDSGFPNAITEVAKVMTWAAENKGYKPHDWKGLPNAETEFSAAASRHRVKGFIQKGEGVAAIDRTDEESNIVHLAHTAFNILAELELVLTGKIK